MIKSQIIVIGFVTIQSNGGDKLKTAIVMLLIIAIAFIGVVSAFTQDGANPFDGKPPATGKANPPVDGPSLPEIPADTPFQEDALPFGDNPPPFEDIV
jgi:hypothetical protein